VFARVIVDSPLPHLDRPFDYSVSEALEGTVRAGSRVRVPFAGRLSSAVVVGLSEAESAHTLKPIKSAGAIPSFTQEALDLASAIATRYGGSLWDVLRLMAPARVASVEKFDWNGMSAAPFAVESCEGLLESASGEGLPTASGVRAAWVAPPAGSATLPTDPLLGWALAAIQDRGSAIIIVPDARAAHALAARASASGLRRWSARSQGDFVLLDADEGPSVRFGSYIAAMRGVARLVIGTRSSAWQPVPDLRAICVWDEGSTTFAEPRAPYPHARTVAAMRAQQTGASFLAAGYALSADAVALVEHGFARRVGGVPDREALPRVDVVSSERREREGGQGRHWMPGAVWSPLLGAARAGVAAILVPQSGYASGLRCSRCSGWAECTECGGDLQRVSGDAVPRCRDCDREAPHWHCAECGGYGFTPAGLGVERLAAQVKRMAAGVPVVVSSSGTGIVADGAAHSGLVVATPAALPAVAGGYGHLAIVGARVNVGEGLGAEYATVRRWMNAAALVAPRSSAGVVSVVGDVAEAVRRALVTWDGWDTGAQDLAQRQQLGLPPHRRAMRLDGPQEAIDSFARAATPLEYDLSRDAEGAWALATRTVMPDLVVVARAIAVERSAASAPPLFLRVDAVPGT
jgi:primosomal protein N' (replication factor Y)